MQIVNWNKVERRMKQTRQINLGTVTIGDKKYKVIEIVSFENGEQDIYLLDVETCEKTKMLFRK